MDKGAKEKQRVTEGGTWVVLSTELEKIGKEMGLGGGSIPSYGILCHC